MKTQQRLTIGEQELHQGGDDLLVRHQLQPDRVCVWRRYYRVCQPAAEKEDNVKLLCAVFVAT